MADIRRRRLANAVWIPLRQSETLSSVGEEPLPGYAEDLLCIGTIAFPADNRGVGNRLGWSDLGHPTAAPYAFREGGYKRAEIYQYNDREDAGFHLILTHDNVGDAPGQWLVDQDLIMALGLIKEGHSWIRPSEGYVEVIRERLDADGACHAIEIKNEFLRDYLAARGLALRIGMYRRHMAIVDRTSTLPNWQQEPVQLTGDDERFEIRVFEVDEHGGLPGRVAVMRVWRTDGDVEEDVPVFGHETNENTAAASGEYEREGARRYRVEGELWREEWLEPAQRSERVRGDDPAQPIHYIVEPDGSTLPDTDLNDEDIGRWLWFRPDVIPALLKYRDAQLSWYTGDTGGIRCAYGVPTHFGVNSRGLICVYAYDVAHLPPWQQRIWIGHNVTPEGGVSEELFAAQWRAQPAGTSAPEARFVSAWHRVNEFVTAWCGAPLFRAHEANESIFRTIHRFRVTDRDSLLSLAKDIARLTADGIDIGSLRSVITPPSGTTWRTLAHLEQALATVTDAAQARSTLTALVGVYELRLGDAHLPSGKLHEAYVLAGVDSEAGPLEQARQLIDGAATSLERIVALVNDHVAGGAE
ncbi:hypothetical protein [Luteibacter sp. ME-Dv--P-043b]|uniref:hypothetical protein n=1 Tax=Luteibacter sp. ME-Dv--P-043b TaxID=3040291 RepID=UPI002556D249|nr:hypothetical protein [Luteibacter sp. ME-Dv--P-043b]